MSELIEVNVENFSRVNVKKWISDFSHKEKVIFAVECADLVIDIYERSHSSKAPRLAIDAAKKWIDSPTDDNKEACRNSAADAADAADASYAAAAASYAADASYAAYAASYAADAAYYAAHAASYAADAAYAGIKDKIIAIIKRMLTPKPEINIDEPQIYTQATFDASVLPPVGCMYKDGGVEITAIAHIGSYVVGHICGRFDESGEPVVVVTLVCDCEPIDTRTEKEKVIDKITNAIDVGVCWNTADIAKLIYEKCVSGDE